VKDSFPPHKRTFRRSIVVFISAALASISCVNSTPAPYPSFSRTFEAIGSSLSPTWHRQDIGAIFAADEAGTLYGLQDFGETLAAYSVWTGDQLWSISVPHDYRGIRSIVASEQAVVTATTVSLAAYKPADGSWLWATPLGTGHVSIVLQLEGDTVRVYYGDDLIEVAIESGKILNRYTRPDLIWLVDNIQIDRVSAAKGMIGTDLRTGRELWTTQELAFYRNEGQPAPLVDKSLLIVPAGDASVCAFDIQNGLYRWCRPEAYVSNVVLSPSGQSISAIRGDFALVGLSLEGGDPVIDVSFLPAELPPSMQHSLYGYTIISVQGQLVVQFGDSGDVFAFTRAEVPSQATPLK